MPLDEFIAGLLPGLDGAGAAVKDHIAAIGAHHQNGMAFAMRIAHHGHQQGLARHAGIHQQFALEQLQILAIALAVLRIGPPFQHAVMIEIGHLFDGGIDQRIDAVERGPVLAGQRDDLWFVGDCLYFSGIFTIIRFGRA